MFLFDAVDYFTGKFNLPFPHFLYYFGGGYPGSLLYSGKERKTKAFGNLVKGSVLLVYDLGVPLLSFFR